MLYAENVGATKFTESSDTVLVFKGGSGTISLTDTSLPGPKVGDLRTNTDQSSANSASAMEHYMSTGWRVFNNCTTSVCNYPTTATALYQLENNITSTDSSTYDGTSTSSPSYSTTAPKYGTYNAVFNGTSNYVEVATNPITTNMTVSFWIKYTSSQSAGTVGLVSDGYTAEWGALSVNILSSNNTLQVRNGNTVSNNTPIYSTTALNTGNWIHCCAVLNGTSSYTIYINGVQEATGSLTYTPTTTGEFRIGCQNQNGTNAAFYSGEMDQIRIFPSVLTASQITELYNESC